MSVGKKESVGPQEKRLNAVDFSFTSRATFDHSVEKVWPYFLDIKAWFTRFTYETLEGEKGKVGELVKCTEIECARTGVPVPYHFYRVVNIEHLRSLVCKAFSAEGGSYGVPDDGSFTFYVFSLVSNDGKTTIVYSASSEHPRISGEQAKAMREQKVKNFEWTLGDETGWCWQNLRKLVEGQSVDSRPDSTVTPRQ